MFDQWTQEREDTLRVLWEQDGRSANEIGKIMHVSRNSVIGKVFRMCLVKPYAPPKVYDERVIAERAERARARKMKAAALQAKQAAVPIQYQPAEPIVSVKGGVPLLDLKRHHCRALVGRGDDGLATFCGRHKAETGAYCYGHARVYYRPAFR